MALGDIARMAQKTNIPLKYIEYNYHDTMAATFFIGKNGKEVFTVFCDHQVNVPLVRTVIFDMLGEIEKELSTFRKRKGTAQTGSRCSTANSISNQQLTVKGKAPQKVVIGRLLKPRLDIIRQALQEALLDTTGQETDVIMTESIEKWASLGPVNKKELPVFSALLCQKISSNSKRKKFLNKIEDTFFGFEK